MSNPPYPPAQPDPHQQPGPDPQPTVGAPPGLYPQQPVPAKRGISTGGTVAIVVGSLIALCCVGGIVTSLAGGDNSGGTDSVTTAERPDGVDQQAKAPANAAPAKKKPGIGAPVRDGKFEFVVTSQKCGVPRVGGQYLNHNAQGQFCLIAVTVKNIGDVPQTLDASSQKAFNTAGQELAADGEASIYANEDHQTFLNQINPGNSVKAILVFDIPKGAALQRLQLHDSPFSGGVEVSLT
jgi:Domain of unknown function (DUF4352)